MKTAVVVAHYNENLDWCTSLQNEYNIVIYSKTDRKYNFIDINKGQEVAMYIKYFIDNYNNLPDKILFLHGHQMAYHQDHTSDYIIKNVNWDLNDYFSVGRRGHYEELSSSSENSEGAFNWVKDNWYIFQNKLEFPKDGLFFYPNGQFVVSKECITQYEQSFWFNLYKWLLTTNIEDRITSRIFEYVWNYIFTKSTHEKIIDDIFIKKHFKQLTKSLINFYMHENMIYVNTNVNVGKCKIIIKNLENDVPIYVGNLEINNESYWIAPSSKKEDLKGIIISVYNKNSIIIYEEYITF